VVAAIISYQHAYELVRSHGESGVGCDLLLPSLGESCVPGKTP
jgi:hypothetical protein